MKKTYWLLLTLFFLVVVAASAWLALLQIKQESLKSIKNTLQTVAKTTHEALHIWISQRKNNLIVIAQNTEVIALTQQLLQIHQLGADIHSSQALTLLRRIMTEKMNINHDIGFFIISPDKINIASMRDSNINQTSVIFKHRRALLARVFTGDTLFIPPIQSEIPLLTSEGSYTVKVPTTFIASPIYSKDKNIIAVITLRIDPSTDFTRVTQLGQIGDSGEAYAFDEKGILITHSRFDHQLQRLGIVPSHGQGMLSIHITNPGGNMLEGFVPKLKNSELPLTLMAKNALLGKAGFNIDGYRDYRGVLVFGSWLWDHDLGFGLTAEIDVEEALIPYYKTRQVVLLVVLVVVLLSFGCFSLWYVMERKTRIAQNKAFAELEQKVAERTQELNELSFTDGMTGVANRRMFDQTLENEWQRQKRNQQPLALIILDIDFFKSYNDHYGHQQGDACLITVAQLLAKKVRRASDLFARYGGEEFVILLPDTDVKQATKIAQDYCLEVLNANIEHEKTQVEGLSQVSISIGVSAITPSVFITSDKLVEQADEKLYLAKNNGRNRVE